ncbi:Fe-Mn family superoxide dismutase [Paenibacillus kribbensis]|uniref:Fe-Mn family superoxide dismutase n=2 Tax=Paenibacillus TaxID=44249 RepID=UPI002DB983AE|nr:Fe-Mn family superoxide dismutase [Paenibacillus kribbensis]MEC0234689.1 Fe-Mn family superoxide dismutase [Paenibacillus kribbensis]
MLSTYGSFLPLRVLEEIRHWKQQESWHVEVIKSATEGLEPAYVQLLDDWRTVFEQTERAAVELLEEQRSALDPAAQAWQDPEAQKSEAQKSAAPEAHTHELAGHSGQPREWGEASSSGKVSLPETVSQDLHRRLDGLLQTANRQSQEYVRQLGLLGEHSLALRQQPRSAGIVLHAAHESQYFLISTTPFQEPGSIERATGLYHVAAEGEHYPEDAFRERQAGIRGEGNWASMGVQSGQTQPAATEKASPGRAVPIGGHRLPPLPYPYNALEPYIDEKTMRIHHDKHHLSYVNDLNKAEKKLEEARKTGDFDLVKHWERELAFNGGGHYLHTLFWTIMSPQGGGKPSGPLAEQIKKDFGSFEAFKKHFSAAAEKVEGGGWAILVWSPRAGRLEILQSEKHQNLTQWESIPLLAIDVWEHAYYLKHQNERNKYIEDWWHVVNWPEVEARYAQASKLRWQPF